MSPPLPTIELPSSYSDLSLQNIRISHVPASSPTSTPVILLTLYRPGKHNAFMNTMMEEMERAFAMFDVDDKVKAIVVTGHGRMFCAGADLDVGLNSGNEPVNEHRDGGGRVALAIHHCRKPTIMAINGSAVGVGMTMGLPAAIRIAAASAKCGFVFARRGIVMEACSSFFLPRLIGYSKAIHLTTTGSTYPATSPLLDGLFSEVLPDPAQVLPRALELAQDIAQNTSVVSTYLMRQMMWRNPGTAEGTHLLDSRLLSELFTSRDKNEGIKSFFEKRSPHFQGTMQEDAPGAYPWWEPVDVRSRAKPNTEVKAKL